MEGGFQRGCRGPVGISAFFIFLFIFETNSEFLTHKKIDVNGEVRCHCNLPVCVGKGYMCKSIKGICFTNNTPTPTHAYTHARNLYHRWAPMHGCIELLSENRQEECVKKARVKTTVKIETNEEVETTTESNPELSCCTEDMCNYREIDVYIQINENILNKETKTDMKKQENTSTGQIWFRAATIAVPIAGGFILIILVLIAGKMLAKENKRQRMAQVLGERYRSEGYMKASPGQYYHPHPLCYHPDSNKEPYNYKYLPSDQYLSSTRNSCYHETHPLYQDKGSHHEKCYQDNPTCIYYQDKCYQNSPKCYHEKCYQDKSRDNHRFSCYRYSCYQDNHSCYQDRTKYQDKILYYHNNHSDYREQDLKPMNKEIQPLNPELEPLNAEMEPLNAEFKQLNTQFENLNAGLETVNRPNELDPLSNEFKPLNNGIMPLNNGIMPLNIAISPDNNEESPGELDAMLPT